MTTLRSLWPLAWWLARLLWWVLTVRPVQVSSVDALAAASDYLPAGSIAVSLRDATYACVTQKEFERLMALIPLRHVPWRKEARDCDDFAEALKVVCSWLFGVNSVAYVEDMLAPVPHAYNMVVLASDAGYPYCKLLEPQRMAWFDKGTGGYGVRYVKYSL